MLVEQYYFKIALSWALIVFLSNEYLSDRHWNFHLPAHALASSWFRILNDQFKRSDKTISLIPHIVFWQRSLLILPYFTNNSLLTSLPHLENQSISKLTPPMIKVLLYILATRQLQIEGVSQRKLNVDIWNGFTLKNIKIVFFAKILQNFTKAFTVKVFSS